MSMTGFLTACSSGMMPSEMGLPASRASVDNARQQTAMKETET
jgi:hypothetical protein